MEEKVDYDEHKPYGRHLIVEMYGCESEKITNPEIIEKVLRKAAKAGNSTPLEFVFHKWDKGAASVLLISESHISMHTWAEWHYSAIDIFMCGQKSKVWDALDCIEKEFNPEYILVNSQRRGMK